MRMNSKEIFNLNGVRDNFGDFASLWRNTSNGTYEKFLRDNVSGEQSTQKILDVLSLRSHDANVTGIFISNGRLDTAAVMQYIRTQNGGDTFLATNRNVIERLVAPLSARCTRRQALDLVLFLLINFQTNNAAHIPEHAETFIAGELNSAAYHTDHDPGAADSVTGKNSPPAVAGDSVCLLPERRLLYLDRTAGAVYEHTFAENMTLSGGTLIPTGSERTAGFAYSAQLGLIAVTETGALSSVTRQDVRSAVPSGRRVVQASAFLSSYLLLLDDGSVVSNVKADTGKWTNIASVRLGLNSVCAITRSLGEVVQFGSDARLSGYSGVKSAHTFTGGEKRFAVLTKGGTLYTGDDGVTAENVSAVCIRETGYVYAKKASEAGVFQLVVRDFGAAEDRIVPLRLDETAREVREIHADNDWCALELITDGGGRMLHALAL